MKSPTSNFNSASFAKRVLIAAGIVIPILLIIWLIGVIFELFLLLVAAILIHCFFKSFAQFINHTTNLPKKWSKVASVIIVLGVIFAINWFLAPHAARQVKYLINQIQQGFGGARAFLQQYWWGNILLSQIPNDFNRFLKSHSYFMGFFATTFGVIVNIYVVLLLAAYFFINPFPYVDGLVALFPKEKRKRIRKTIYEVYRTMQLWLRVN